MTEINIANYCRIIMIPPHQEEQIRSYLEQNKSSLKSVIEQKYSDNK